MKFWHETINLTIVMEFRSAFLTHINLTLDCILKKIIKRITVRWIRWPLIFLNKAAAKLLSWVLFPNIGGMESRYILHNVFSYRQQVVCWKKFSLYVTAIILGVSFHLRRINRERFCDTLPQWNAEAINC